MQTDSASLLGSATYSPEDNKLRFYPDSRLSKEDYDRAKSAGFKWAPKQQLFVAPAWDPSREDLMLEWCGEIGDEDKSLVERQEERADRFKDYSANRAQDADQARKAVSAIADNIPLGQPILVGHHSERRARRDAEKIENGMRKAIRMWDQSQYWKDRAASAIAHAKYKERPDVRARRIKGLEADKRRHERTKAEAETAQKLWLRPMTHDQAYQFAGGSSHGHLCAIDRDNGSYWSAYDVLAPDDTRYKACPAMTVEQVQERARLVYPRCIARSERWIAHYENRLAYERAMLAEDGGLTADKFNLAVGGRILFSRGHEWHVITRLNRSGGALVSVSVVGYFRAISLEEIKDYKPPTEETWTAARALAKTPPLCNYDRPEFLKMTLEEWKRDVPQWSDFPKIVQVEASATHARHRIRNMQKPGGAYYHHQKVFITDLKETPPPPLEAEPPKPPRELAEPNPVKTIWNSDGTDGPCLICPPPDDGKKFEALRDTLAAGVKVVSANQLFPTPPDLAARLVDLAELTAGDRVLEPSAGTGALCREILTRGIFSTHLVAVELNRELIPTLSAIAGEVFCADFLELAPRMGRTFDRVIMNPPFENGADIKHINAAFELLEPGGVLLSICVNMPSRREAFEGILDQWIELPAGSFKSQGTSVNTAIVVCSKPWND